MELITFEPRTYLDGKWGGGTRMGPVRNIVYRRAGI